MQQELYDTQTLRGVMEAIEAFGYILDIESIELFYVSNGIKNPDGIGELARNSEPTYEPETQTLVVTLQFHNNGNPYCYEYAIAKEGDEYTYREIQSQREEREESETYPIELIDEGDQVVFRDIGNQYYSYTFCIPKMED